MRNYAFVVVTTIPGAAELYAVAAPTEEEARDIITSRSGSRPNEYVAVASRLSDETARRIGADLSKHGTYANFTPE